MNINYEVKNCPHCNSSNYKVLGDEQQVYGLISIKSDNTFEYDKCLPVMPIVCKDCGHIELVHINAKAIQDND